MELALIMQAAVPELEKLAQGEREKKKIYATNAPWDNMLNQKYTLEQGGVSKIRPPHFYTC